MRWTAARPGRCSGTLTRRNRLTFADPAEYELIPKLTPAHRARLRNKSLQRADQILADCDAAGISILTWQDSLYPERLRNIDLPPLVLYWRGTLPRFDEEIAIAMAGTRTATPYGRMAAGQLAYQITRLGGLVLTGVVAGCDHHAADGALKAGGPLVCVTAGGVDVPYYNTDNGRRLLEDAAACGAVLSEYPTPHAPSGRSLRHAQPPAHRAGTWHCLHRGPGAQRYPECGPAGAGTGARCLCGARQHRRRRQRRHQPSASPG